MAFQNATSRPVAGASVATRNDFLKRVYGWMAFGVALSAAGSFLAVKAGIGMWMATSGWVGSLLMTAGWMGLAWVAQSVRHTAGVNTIAFAAYGLFTGVVMSGLIQVALIMGDMLTGSSMTYVGQAFGITAVAFGALSFYAATTKRDFSFMGGMLTVGLIALIALGLINLFIQSSMFALILSFAGVMLFTGFILFDTQQIVRHYPENEHLAGALVLFTNFAIMFMKILSILLQLAGGNRK